MLGKFFKDLKTLSFELLSKIINELFASNLFNILCIYFVFLISVLKNESFEKANYNTKFIENNLSLFTKESENVKKNIKNTINE